jgi:hypothetical protein
MKDLSKIIENLESARRDFSNIKGIDLRDKNVDFIVGLLQKINCSKLTKLTCATRILKKKKMQSIDGCKLWNEIVIDVIRETIQPKFPRRIKAILICTDIRATRNKLMPAHQKIRSDIELWDCTVSEIYQCAKMLAEQQ